MYDRDSMFPDDVPVADAAEQQRATTDSLDEDPHEDHDEINAEMHGDVHDDVVRRPDADVPLEANVLDWHEQQETVPIAPELEEPDR
jgi:hypothetical protein